MNATPILATAGIVWAVGSTSRHLLNAWLDDRRTARMWEDPTYGPEPTDPADPLHDGPVWPRDADAWPSDICPGWGEGPYAADALNDVEPCDCPACRSALEAPSC